MRIKNHRLYNDDNTATTFMQADKTSGTVNPQYLIMHYTAGASGLGTAQYFASKSAKASAHVVIDRDGSIIQCVKFDTIAWHAGKSQWKSIVGLNRHSIGIEMANWGLLMEGPGGFKSHTGQPVASSDVVIARHKNGPAKDLPWEMFTPDQVAAAISVAQAIVEAYGIPEDAILGHDDIAPTRKIDPGPAFDLNRFRAKVFGRGEDAADLPDRYRIESATGLNLRSGPGVGHSVIRLLDDGTEVHVIEREGRWWLVTAIVNGVEDQTGYVHSKWLRAV